MKRKSNGATLQRVALHVIAHEYLDMKGWVLRCGFEDELEWQYAADWTRLTTALFLRELSWVVLCSGFRESIVRNCFQDVAKAFEDWGDLDWVLSHETGCVRRALQSFGNERKIRSIVEACRYVRSSGLECIRDQVAAHGASALERFPMIGPVTAIHLAKNLGLHVAKPDRHLCRFAAYYGYETPHELCGELSDFVGEPIAVVDMVLWRYATLGEHAPSVPFAVR